MIAELKVLVLQNLLILRNVLKLLHLFLQLANVGFLALAECSLYTTSVTHHMET